MGVGVSICLTADGIGHGLRRHWHRLAYSVEFKRSRRFGLAPSVVVAGVGVGIRVGIGVFERSRWDSLACDVCVTAGLIKVPNANG